MPQMMDDELGVPPTKKVKRSYQEFAATRNVTGRAEHILHTKTRVYNPSFPDRVLFVPSQLRIEAASKRQRSAVYEEQGVNNLEDGYDHLNRAPRHEVRNSYTNAELAPCHICHKRPIVRKDLAKFTKCEGCERRMCDVCSRECDNKIGLRMDMEDEFDSDSSTANEYYIAEMHGVIDSDSMVYEDPKFGTITFQKHGIKVCSACSKECGLGGGVQCNRCLGRVWSGVDGD